MEHLRENLMYLFFTFLLIFISNIVFGSEIKRPKDLKNPVFYVGNQVYLKDNEIYFTVEIPEGSTYKFELRTATGLVINDRILCPREIKDTKSIIHSFPVSYGISAGRFNQDEAPVDVIVFGESHIFWKMVLENKVVPKKVRIIGLMKFEDCEGDDCTIESNWVQDWKILAVVPNDYVYGKIFNTTQMSKRDLKKITDFWLNYRPYKAGISQVRIKGFLNKQQALKFLNNNFKLSNNKQRIKEIKECRKLFYNTYKSKTVKHEKDKKYLSCLQRVYYEGHSPKNPNFMFFIKYSAYQLLLKLGEKNVSLDNSIQLMKQRKKQKKIYYRYMSYDNIAPPGTGQPIFEWIKTKNRNAECASEFPDQHYDNRNLIDIEKKSYSH